MAAAGQFLQRYSNLLYATVPDLVQCYNIDTNDMPAEMVTFNIPTPPGLTRRMEAYAIDTHTDHDCSSVLLDTFIDTGRGSSQATGIATRTYSRKQVRRSLGAYCNIFTASTRGPVNVVLALVGIFFRRNQSGGEVA